MLAKDPVAEGRVGMVDRAELEAISERDCCLALSALVCDCSGVIRLPPESRFGTR